MDGYTKASTDRRNGHNRPLRYWNAPRATSPSDVVQAATYVFVTGPPVPAPAMSSIEPGDGYSPDW